MMVMTTFSTREEGEKIAEILLKKKLAACIQLKEIESLYTWDGKMEKSTEVQGIIKTKEKLYEEVEKVINLNHSYDLPQVVGVKIDRGSKGYLEWISEETIS